MARQATGIQRFLHDLPTAVLLATLVWVLMQTAPLLATTLDISQLTPQLADDIRSHSTLAWLVGVAWLVRNLGRQLFRARGIDDLHWEKFEHLVADVYRRNGYRVVSRAKSGADGGVDFRAVRRGKQYIVQCKRWSRRVGVPVVREMAGLLAAERRVNGVIIVTNNDFTREAVAFADGKPIELVNGAKLQRMMKRR